MTGTDPIYQPPIRGRGRWLLQSGAGVTLLGLAINIVLSGLKIVAGLVFNSGALLADGVHSAGDMVSDVAVLASLTASYRKPDANHPYGHRRIQTLACMFIGGMVAAAGLGVTISAANQWRAGKPIDYGWTPFVIAIISVFGKEFSFRITRVVGRRTGDTALLANAWHHRTDAFTSLAAAVGMFGVAVGGEKWGFLDHILAIALSGVLLAMGLKICLHAAQELIDRAPAKAVMENIASIVARTEGVHSYHAFRMRQSAGKLLMDVHVQVDPNLTVSQGHDIATDVRDRIFRADRNVTSVIVHVEPAEELESPE